MYSIPQGASAAYFKQSKTLPEEAVAAQGPNFGEHPTLESLLGLYERIGFQANSLGKATKIVDKTVSAMLSSTDNSATPAPSLLSVVGASLMNQPPPVNRTSLPTLT
jgi:deoxyhypusine synthase